MLFPYTKQHILSIHLVFSPVALLLLLLLSAMAKAEEGNNLNLPHRDTVVGSGDNKGDGLGVNFPGYYSLELLSELLPVDLLIPEKEAGKTTTKTPPIDITGVSTTTAAGKRKSSSGYPVDWSAVADAYYRSMDLQGSEKKNPQPSES